MCVQRVWKEREKFPVSQLLHTVTIPATRTTTCWVLTPNEAKALQEVLTSPTFVNAYNPHKMSAWWALNSISFFHVKGLKIREVK